MPHVSHATIKLLSNCSHKGQCRSGGSKGLSGFRGVRDVLLDDGKLPFAAILRNVSPFSSSCEYIDKNVEFCKLLSADNNDARGSRKWLWPVKLSSDLVKARFNIL